MLPILSLRHTPLAQCLSSDFCLTAALIVHWVRFQPRDSAVRSRAGEWPNHQPSPMCGIPGRRTFPRNHRSFFERRGSICGLIDRRASAARFEVGPPQPPHLFKPCKLAQAYEAFETHHAIIVFANGGGPPHFFQAVPASNHMSFSREHREGFFRAEPSDPTT